MTLPYASSFFNRQENHEHSGWPLLWARLGWRHLSHHSIVELANETPDLSLKSLLEVVESPRVTGISLLWLKWPSCHNNFCRWHSFGSWSCSSSLWKLAKVEVVVTWRDGHNRGAVIQVPGRNSSKLLWHPIERLYSLETNCRKEFEGGKFRMMVSLKKSNTTSDSDASSDKNWPKRAAAIAAAERVKTCNIWDSVQTVKCIQLQYSNTISCFFLPCLVNGGRMLWTELVL